jgi:hypothetical protein
MQSMSIGLEAERNVCLDVLTGAETAAEQGIIGQA